MREHVYTSTKGADFLSWDEWANKSLSEEDLIIYLTPEAEGEQMAAEKLALYARWVAEEQILTHTVTEAGLVVQQTNELK